MIKSLKNELYRPLTLIINQMLHTGIYPNAFKIAKVIPIFKKGRPKFADKLQTYITAAYTIKNI